MSQARFPGHELRARREAMGLRPEDVYRKIRIPLEFIRNIESGELELLPAPCYSVGFLKTYCLLLELNPHRFADTYQACIRPAVVGFLARSAGRRTRPKWVANALSWAAVCGVLALLWFAYVSVTGPYFGPAHVNPAQAATDDEPRLPDDSPAGPAPSAFR
jgi:cytoskeletal protein RodZ